MIHKSKLMKNNRKSSIVMACSWFSEINERNDLLSFLCFFLNRWRDVLITRISASGDSDTNFVKLLPK